MDLHTPPQVSVRAIHSRKPQNETHVGVDAQACDVGSIIGCRASCGSSAFLGVLQPSKFL